MNFLNKFYIVFLAVIVLLTSCNPENLDETIPDDPGFTPVVTDIVEGITSTALIASSFSGGIVLDSSGCLTLLFPFDLEQSDGTVVTVEDEAQYNNLVATGDSLTLLLPFSLYAEADGMTYVINEPEDIIAPLEVCGILYTIGDPSELCDTEAHVLLFFNAHNIFTLYDCPFDINYPVEMFINGSSTASSVGDVNEYFSTTGAPSNIQDVELVYPITVTQDGVEVTLNNDQEVCDFIEGC